MHPLISCPYCKELKYKHKGKNDPESTDHTEINSDERVVVPQFDSADAHFPWVTKVQLVMLLLLLGLSK